MTEPAPVSFGGGLFKKRKKKGGATTKSRRQQAEPVVAPKDSDGTDICIYIDMKHLHFSTPYLYFSKIDVVDEWLCLRQTAELHLQWRCVFVHAWFVRRTDYKLVCIYPIKLSTVLALSLCLSNVFRDVSAAAAAIVLSCTYTNPPSLHRSECLKSVGLYRQHRDRALCLF